MKKRGYEVENGAFSKSSSASGSTMQSLLEEGMKKRGYTVENGSFTAPKKQTRPLEEIRADINKAQEQLFEPNRMTTYVEGKGALNNWAQRKVGQASAKIPGWDYHQTEYLDEMGKTESNGTLAERFIENILSPGYWTPTHEGEALYDELQDIHDQTGANPWPDAYPPNSFTVSGEKHEMGQEDKEQYQQTRGSIYEDLAGQFFRGKKNLFTPEEAVEILTGIKSYAGAAAKNEFFEENDINAKSPTNFITKAVAGVQEADIPFVTYLDFWVKKGNLTYEVDEKGNRKVKEAVVKLIDSMNLTDKQKDWLFASESYKNPPAWS